MFRETPESIVGLDVSEWRMMFHKTPKSIVGFDVSEWRILRVQLRQNYSVGLVYFSADRELESLEVDSLPLLGVNK